MGLLKNRLLPFFVGMVMGGAFVSTFTLMYWSMTSSFHDSLLIPEGSKIASHLEVRQEGKFNIDINRSGGGSCDCNQSPHKDLSPHTPKPDGKLRETSTKSPLPEWKQSVFRAVAKKKDFRDTILMGVARTGSEMEWAESVSETWGHEVSEVIFYKAEDTNVTSLQARALGLELVELPSASSMLTLRASILHHMTQHFINSHLWFAVVTGNTYVHLKRLEEVLDRMNPYVPLAIGPSHNCLDGMDGGGALLVSQGMMKQLVPRLRDCLTPGGSEEKARRCLGNTLKKNCLPLSQLSDSFVDASGKPLSSEVLKSKSTVFTSLFTYAPLHSRDEMAMLHHHNKRAEFEISIARTRTLEQDIKEMCSGHGDNFFSPSFDQDCNVAMCSCQVPSIARCPPSGVVTNIPHEFEPRTVYDYYPWEYFDTKTIYPEMSIQPNFKLKLKRNSKVELQQALTRAIQKSSMNYGRPLKFKRLVNGWVRHNPYVGNEYIIDYLLMDDGKKWVSERVNLVRPLAKNFISVHQRFDTTTVVNFIVPLSKVSKRFKEFMSMYEVLVLLTNQKAALVLCVYGKEDIKEVKEITAKYNRQYPDMKYKILEGQHKFSRSRALDLGFSSLGPHDLAFVCDVDMTITKTFLDRCRSNAMEGKMVYYPEFFKLYNMEYVYWNRSKPDNQARLLREHGHWAHYSFGMLCIYKADYQKVGGFNKNIEGWGGEDVMFFHKIVRNRITIMRAPDVALSHRWHSKECSADILSPQQFTHCLSSRNENLADRRELAKYVYQQGPLKVSKLNYTQKVSQQPATDGFVHNHSVYSSAGR